MNFSGKTAIVTGGGRDIGRACVMRLAQAFASSKVIRPFDVDTIMIPKSFAGKYFCSAATISSTLKLNRGLITPHLLICAKPLTIK